jgi:hypothetical protein
MASYRIEGSPAAGPQAFPTDYLIACLRRFEIGYNLRRFRKIIDQLSFDREFHKFQATKTQFEVLQNLRRDACAGGPMSSSGPIGAVRILRKHQLTKGRPPDCRLREVSCKSPVASPSTISRSPAVKLHFRSRGLAPTVKRHVVSSIIAESSTYSPLLLSRNPPSWATALRSVLGPKIATFQDRQRNLRHP